MNKPSNKEKKPPALTLKPLVQAVHLVLGCGLVLSSPGKADPLPVPRDVQTALRVTRNLAARSMQVHQAQTREVFRWNQFNIDRGYRVEFKQPSSSAVALNKIFQNDPSRIFGTLTANGQVYLVNSNGFVFGPDSRVNVNSLVATSLDISEQVFEKGITKVVDQDGSAALVVPTDANGNPLPIGDIKVLKGARIVTDTGGRVILAASKVTNEGSIETPDGQTILAAADGKLYLQEADPNSGVRGLLVEVKTGGTVENDGVIDVGKGNATLLGFAVNQRGRISAKTAVRVAGQIRLLARDGGQSFRPSANEFAIRSTRTTRQDGGSTRSARVTFGSGSRTEVLLDRNDTSTAIDRETQPKGRVEAMGHTIRVASNATLTVPSGKVELVATENPQAPQAGSVLTPNDSRILLEEGSRIDVSGTDEVRLPMERNVVEVKLTANELRDSPLQKGGVLDRATVKVDIRKGTPLFDVAPEAARIQKGLAERNSAGGSITLRSEGSIVAAPGSSMDVSGGAVTYEGGVVDTTLLVSNGQVFDISDADPLRPYSAILGQVNKTYRKWGITETYFINGLQNVGHYEPGYVEGQPGGSLNIQAPRVALEGQFQGHTIRGRHQRLATKRPQPAALKIDLGSATIRQDIRFTALEHPLNLGLDEPFPEHTGVAGEPAELVVDPRMIAESGMGRLVVSNAGKVTISNHTNLTLPVHGSLDVTGRSATIGGHVTIPSGNIVFHANDPDSGTLTLLSGARLDTSGIWTNDSPALRDGIKFEPIALDGGTVSLTGLGNVSLEAGSTIDVSGGAWLDQGLNLTSGTGGTIEVRALGDANQNRGANLSLGGSLLSYGIEQGGTLKLESNEILLGAGPGSGSTASEGLTPLRLMPEFFHNGGFGSYELTANRQGAAVTPGTRINLKQQNRVLREDFASTPSGPSLGTLGKVGLLPDYVRKPVSLELTLSQSTTPKADPSRAVHVARDARIETDPGGSVALTSDGSLFLDGTVVAPGGEVSLRITNPKGTQEPGFPATQGIWLGSESRIDVAGVSVPVPDPSGRRIGEVLSGGKVTIQADRGQILAQRGYVIDASGTSDVFDLPAPLQDGPAFAPTPVYSNAGSILFKGAESVILDTLPVARPGGAGAAGGHLSVEVNPQLRQSLDPFFAPTPKRDVVAELLPGNSPEAAGIAQGTARPNANQARAAIPVDRLQQTGLDSLVVKTVPDPRRNQDEIRITPGTRLHLTDALVMDSHRITQGSGGSGGVNLAATYVALGSSQLNPDDTLFSATPESGQLSVQARALDLVGPLDLQAFDHVNLSASEDIRLRGVRIGSREKHFRGELRTAGDLTLEARQAYPTTLSEFTLRGGNGPQDTLTVLGKSQPVPVLSAAGRLTLEAGNIVQKGTLKAPQGEIHLKAAHQLILANGSETSTSGEGEIVPFGRTQGGLNWIYPLGSGLARVFGDPGKFEAPPAKRVLLEGAAIEIEDSALVNNRGGGDLLAFEVIRDGPGGSIDFFDPVDPSVLDGSFDYQQKFAVLPGLGSSYAPYDPLEYPVTDLSMGDSVFLEGGGGLPRGTYALLPPHYALLPGAFLITPVNQRDLIAGETLRRVDGAPIVAGYRTRAGTGYRASRNTGFVVEPGSIVRTRSDFEEHRANRFFADQAVKEGFSRPSLPMDGGQLSITTGSALSVKGRLEASGVAGGRDGGLDVAATSLIVEPDASQADPAGSVVLLDSDLNALNLPRLLLGGITHFASQGKTLETRADTVTIADGARLSAGEVTLLARQKVSLGAASVNTTQGRQETAETDTIDGGSAILRLTSGTGGEVRRSGSASILGDMVLANGATLSSQGTMVADVRGDAQISARFVMDGGDMVFRGPQLSLGAVPTGTTGMSVSNASLDGLQGTSVHLESDGALAVYGDVSVQGLDVTVKADQIAGFGPMDGLFSLSASREMHIQGSPNGAGSMTATGHGRLVAAGENIFLGPGEISLQGFNQVELRANSELVGQGAGHLLADADVDLSAARLSGDSGSATRIEAPGHFLKVARPTQAGTTFAERGRAINWTLEADQMEFSGRIDAPGGQVTLRALQGDLVLGNGRVNVSGRRDPYLRTAGQIRDFVFGPGRFNAQSDGGDVLWNSSFSTDFSPPSGGGPASGVLRVSAPQGKVALPSGNPVSGMASLDRLEIEANSLEVDGAANPFSGFADLLQTGFVGDLKYHQHTGDIVLPATQQISGQRIELQSDQGSIQVAGMLRATSKNDTGVLLEAGDFITLAGTGRIEAHSEQGTAKVTLASLDSDADGIGGVRFQTGASVDVSPATSDGQGEVLVETLRVDRNGDGTIDDIALDTAGQPLDTLVTGTDAVRVAAFRNHQDEGILNASDIAALKSTTKNDMEILGLNNELGTRLGSAELIPGVRVMSTGDLNLTSPWDLSAWQTSVAPGLLVLQAAGDLTVSADLSDGFTRGNTPFGPVNDLLMTGRSWSYRLVAGRDVTIASAKVRSGTGDIVVEAGRDLKLVDQNSVIYTAGHADGTDRYGTLPVPRFPTWYAEYPIDGGDVTLTAGRDIQGVQGDQFFVQWLVRTGNFSATGDNRNARQSAWGIALDRPSRSAAIFSPFRQNIGALGGGRVSVRAGNDIRDLSVVLPTTGKQVGDPQAQENLIQVQGGGDFSVEAGGEIQGGVYYTGRGRGSLKAGSAISPSDSTGLGTILALGEGSVSASAIGDVTIGAFLNPTVVAQQPRGRLLTLDNRTRSYFFTYGSDSAVSVDSAAGDVVLQSDAGKIKDTYGLDLNSVRNDLLAFEIAPPSVTMTAGQGSILLEHNLNLFPSPSGNLILAAAKSISRSETVAGNSLVNLSDADPALLPSFSFPSMDLTDAAKRLSPSSPAIFSHATVAIHRQDPRPAIIVARDGDIKRGDGVLTFSLATAGLIEAGRDIENVDFSLQHPGANGNLSVMRAGRDIRYSIDVDSNGALQNQSLGSVTVGGEGTLILSAGRDIDLGASNGVVSLGDTANPALPDERGADLLFLAGLANQPDLPGFIRDFLQPGEAGSLTEHQQALLQFMRARSGDPALDYPAALSAFKALPDEDQLPLVTDVLFQALAAAGRKAAKSGALADYQPGFDAIQTLFPGEGYRGDVSLFFSRIQTLAGGNIGILAPGGGVNAGLAVAFAGAKEPSELGIVAQRAGNIKALVKDNFNVNASRVFTLGGGDILVWSSQGNIDAGRGAAAALFIPPPINRFDENGRLVTEFPPVNAGSGIQAAISPTGQQGDVLLFAPNGVVDAGLAGIKGGFVTIGANQVLNGDQVSFSLGSSGVPVASSGALAAGLGGAANAASASASKSAGEAVSRMAGGAMDETLSGQEPVGFLTVELVGFGSPGQK